MKERESHECLVSFETVGETTGNQNSTNLSYSAKRRANSEELRYSCLSFSDCLEQFVKLAFGVVALTPAGGADVRLSSVVNRRDRHHNLSYRG